MPTHASHASLRLRLSRMRRARASTPRAMHRRRAHTMPTKLRLCVRVPRGEIEMNRILAMTHYVEGDQIKLIDTIHGYDPHDAHGCMVMLHGAFVWYFVSRYEIAQLLEW